LVLKEPHRGQMESALYEEDAIEGVPSKVTSAKEEDGLNEQLPITTYSETITWDKAIKTLYIPTNILGFLQGIPGTIPWGVMIVYLNDYLAQNKAMGVETATLILTVFNVGGLCGGLLGGFIGQKIYNKKRNSLPIFMGISTVAGSFPVLYLLNAPSHLGREPLAICFLVSFIGGILTAFSGANVRAILVNVNTPETRGTVFSLFNLMDDLGKGFGPFLVAIFVARFNRLTALNLGVLCWLGCGFFQFLIAFTIDHDVIRMEDTLLQSRYGDSIPLPKELQGVTEIKAADTIKEV